MQPLADVVPSLLSGGVCASDVAIAYVGSVDTSSGVQPNVARPRGHLLFDVPGTDERQSVVTYTLTDNRHWFADALQSLLGFDPPPTNVLVVGPLPLWASELVIEFGMANDVHTLVVGGDLTRRRNALWSFVSSLSFCSAHH